MGHSEVIGDSRHEPFFGLAGDKLDLPAEHCLKLLCGRVINCFAKAKVVQVQLNSDYVSLNDRFLITGPTTGAVEGVITSLRVGDTEAERAEKGMEITFPFETVVRKNDSFFILLPRNPEAASTPR